MIIRSAQLKLSAPDLGSCPDWELPEFAFIGRSNVGKSSLVNLLTRVKDLAKVSATPGKTRLMNFYTLNNQWSLVDLPGYGYAKVARKQREKFSAFVADYLRNRPNLRGTFVLIDSRLEPQPIDLDFLTWMVGNGLPFVLVFTKTDKLTAKAAQKNRERFLVEIQTVSDDEPRVLSSSSKNGEGRAEILGLISAALAETAEHPA